MLSLSWSFPICPLQPMQDFKIQEVTLQKNLSKHAVTNSNTSAFQIFPVCPLPSGTRLNRTEPTRTDRQTTTHSSRKMSLMWLICCWRRFEAENDVDLGLLSCCCWYSCFDRSYVRKKQTMLSDQLPLPTTTNCPNCTRLVGNTKITTVLRCRFIN